MILKLVRKSTLNATAGSQMENHLLLVSKTAFSLKLISSVLMMMEMMMTMMMMIMTVMTLFVLSHRR